MRLKYSFEIVELQDDIIAVPVGAEADQMRGIVKLNQSGKEIFDLLREDTTEDAIVSVLSDKYDDDRDVIMNYVHSLIESLRQVGIIS